MKNLTESQREEITSWIRLMAVPGVGSETARRLLAALGVPQLIFSSGYEKLARLVTDKIARAILLEPNAELLAQIETTLTWCAEPDNYFLSLADEEYPRALLDIPDPPPVLYVKGRLDLLSRPALAVVGSRNPTTQGETNAEQFSKALAAKGLTIVSGLALGIDTSAHLGALIAGKNGASTIAVMATGLDMVYPARNRTLAHRISREGVLVSEQPLGMKAIAHNFPRRNRIISGLAQGVLVVEGALQSGSLITAREAAEQGRDVFAIPGSIHSPLSKGCHRLIKEGAKLVESADDVLSELHIDVRASMTKESAKDKAARRKAAEPEVASAQTGPAMEDAPPIEHFQAEKASVSHSHPAAVQQASSLLDIMGYDPISPEQLAQRSGHGVAVIQAGLLELEMFGQVERLAGGLYQRLNSG